jgi:phosphate ABC transporter permease protein PstC
VSSISDVPPPVGLPRPDRASAARSAHRQDRVFIRAIQAIALLTLVVIAAVAVFVFIAGWPSFRANGLSWFTAGPIPLDRQLGYAFTGGPDGQPYTQLNAWPAIAGTIMSTFGALLIAFPLSLLTAVFMAELAPKRIAAILSPIVTMLAATPSVVFGLFAILVIGPWITNHLISQSVANELAIIVPIGGASVLLATLVLAVMIAPLMTAIFTDALRAVPTKWKEGAIALGCDPWRMSRRVSITAIRPALVAGTSLAIGRAVGEAIAVSMAGGGIAFVPNPADGIWFLFEPVRPLAPTVVDYSEGFSGDVLRSNLFAIGVVLFITTAALTVGAKIASASAAKRLGGS